MMHGFFVSATKNFFALYAEAVALHQPGRSQEAAFCCGCVLFGESSNGATRCDFGLASLQRGDPWGCHADMAAAFAG